MACTWHVLPFFDVFSHCCQALKQFAKLWASFQHTFASVRPCDTFKVSGPLYWWPTPAIRTGVRRDVSLKILIGSYLGIGSFWYDSVWPIPGDTAHWTSNFQTICAFRSHSREAVPLSFVGFYDILRFYDRTKSDGLLKQTGRQRFFLTKSNLAWIIFLASAIMASGCCIPVGMSKELRKIFDEISGWYTG